MCPPKPRELADGGLANRTGMVQFPESPSSWRYSSLVFIDGCDVEERLGSPRLDANAVREHPALHRFPAGEIGDKLLCGLTIQDEPKRCISTHTVWNISVWRRCSGRNVAKTDLVLGEEYRQILKPIQAFVYYTQSSLAGMATHAQADRQHGRANYQPPANCHSLSLTEFPSSAGYDIA